jgi:hypothetical protein
MLFNDWASLQFLGEISPLERMAPAFYGGNRSAGLFVMEDIGAGTRLDHLLLGDDPDVAEAGLIAYATMHGRLHALSMSQREVYAGIREALGPGTPLPIEYYRYDWLKPLFHSLADQLAIPVISGVDEELEALTSMIVDPGPFLGFMQVDACPDNCMLVDGSWRMLDFEGAHYGHVLLEGAYCRMPMPTCWCAYRMPEHIMRRVEAAYRAELVRGCCEAGNDDLFMRGVVGACITWALGFHRFMRPLDKMLSKDRTLIALSDRQRSLLYINSAARISMEAQSMLAIGGTLQAMAEKLFALWPEAMEPPYYPAFR